MNNIYHLFMAVLSFFVVSACNNEKETLSNPIIDGYYADPEIVFHDGVYFIYATKDPWGGDDLAVFETTDFKTFKSHQINWPSKEACTTSESSSAMVWAPSVIKGKDGRFYMYVSIGSEIWAGSSDTPLGPWKNMKKDNTPLISRNYFEGFHMIDAEAFIDDDGQAYLYWGSGLNWVNGACFAVKLEPDMLTFIGEPQNITPPNFFEGAKMIKHEGLYYLMYSNGKATDETYNIQYSIGETPFGPWTLGKNNPIASTKIEKRIVGPGHHTVFEKGDQKYILYHKIFPQEDDYVLRQICLDSLNFTKDNFIKKVSFNGVEF